MIVRSCRGIGQEQAAVARQKGGAFIDLEADGFPVVGRHRQAGGLGTERGRRGQRRQIEIAVGGDARFMLRPAQIAHATMNEGRRIQGEGIPRCFKLSGQRPFPGQRVYVHTAQDIGADVELVIAIAGGEIDMPLTIEMMQFGRPYIAGHFSAFRTAPDDGFLGCGKSRQGAGTADGQSVIFRHRGHHVIIAVVVPEDLRIGALQHQRVDDFSGIGRLRENRGHQTGTCGCG